MRGGVRERPGGWESHMDNIGNTIQEKYREMLLGKGAKPPENPARNDGIGAQNRDAGAMNPDQENSVNVDGLRRTAESFLGKRLRILKEAYAVSTREWKIYDPRKPSDYEQVIRKREQEAQRELQEAMIGDTSKLHQTLEEIAIAKQRMASESANPGTLQRNSVDENVPFVDKKIVKMLEKFGWEQGQGIGLNSNGLLNPLIPQKTSAHTAVIVASGPQSTTQAPPASSGTVSGSAGVVRQQLYQSQAVMDDPRIAPMQEKYLKNLHKATKVVVVQNTLTQRQATGAMKEELEMAAKEFGEVVRIDYQKMGRNEDNPQALRIFILFAKREHAAFCKLHFNNAKLSELFGTKVASLGVSPLTKAVARFYPEEAYANGVYTK